MKSELIQILTLIEQERGIDRETLFEAIEESLLAAAKKAVSASRDVSVKVDRNTGEIQCWAKLIIADEVENPDSEIALKDVQLRYPNKKYGPDSIGQEVDWEVESKDFGRIAAQNAKQIIVQRIRQAEKNKICESYSSQLNTLITGEVRRFERKDVIIEFDQAEGILSFNEKIPGEDFEVNDIVTALLIEINMDKPGPTLIVSRASTDFVRKLFEREVTEISEGLVEIMGIAREAGYRTKIAVASSDPKVDPVGACVGVKGQRVKIIVRELSGEKVDIIHYDPDIEKYVANALKPAKLSNISIDQENKAIKIEVPEDQLSLSIGKKGQNARLASKLIGWKIDIVKEDKPEESAEPNFQEQLQNAIDNLAETLGLEKDLAETLVSNGYVTPQMVADADLDDLAQLEGFDYPSAEAIKAVAEGTKS